MKKKCIALFLIVSTFLYTCNGTKNKPAQEEPSTTTTSLNATWKLHTTDGKLLQLNEEEERPVIEINVEEKRFSGKGVCNRLFGTIKLGNNNALTITEVGSTKMMCPNIALEDIFINALREVKAYRLKEGELYFLGMDGGELMSFKRVEESGGN